MASVRGLLNIQSLNELTYENRGRRACLTEPAAARMDNQPIYRLVRPF